MKLIKIKVFIIIISTLYSCSDKNRETKKFYQNGNLKSVIYYSSKNAQKDSIYVFYNSDIKKIKKRYIYKNNIVFATFFYKNGKIFKKGELHNGMPIGKWYYYNKNGFLSDIREYMVIEDNSILNKILFLNKKGDTVKIGFDDFNTYDQKEFIKEEFQYKHSNYMDIVSSKDTIQIGQPYRAILNYYTPFHKNLNSKIRVYIGDDFFKLNNNFSNVNNLSLHKFESLSNDTINQKWYPNASEYYDYMSVFGKHYKTPGKKLLKGFMVEFVKDSLGKEKAVNKIYFKIPIYVKKKKMKLLKINR